MRIMRKKEEVSVKRLIHQRLAKYHKSRGYTHIHASDVTKEDFCPREVVLLDKANLIPAKEFIGTALAVTFEHGNENNELVANRWLRDIIIGDWKCLECSFVMKFQKDPKTCVRCGAKSHAVQYQEVRFRCQKTGISCGVDIILDVGEGKLLPVELKTIDKNRFKDSKGGKELVAPLAEHKQRSALYLHLIDNSDHPHKDKINTDRLHILYRSKGHGIKDMSIKDYPFMDDLMSPFKEFVVTKDRGIIDPPLRKGWAVNEARTHGGIPEGICPTSFCDRAAACKVSKDCFREHNKANILWKKGGV